MQRSAAVSESEPVSGLYGSTYVPLPAGTRLRDRYIIDRQLGQGGFGRTYVAQDTGRFNESMVLKELTPSVQGTEALRKAEELFQREAATLYRLDHPQIPRFWEIFQAQKRLFLVQDFVEGHTYQQLQEKQRHFSESEMMQLFRDLLPVLNYLHQQGVIHRDISPDNIMRRDLDGLPVLIDLGGVKQVAMDVATQVVSAPMSGFSSGSGTRLGKIGYAPDEQMRLGLVAPHSDLYALAVTALVLMTGKLPQDLQDPQSLDWTWQQDLNLSPSFSNLLQTMLAPRPVERYQSAEEVLKQLSLTAAPPPTVPPTDVVAAAPPPPPITPPPTLVTNPAPTVPVSPTVPAVTSKPKGGSLWKWGCAIASLIVLLPVGGLILLIIIGVIVGPQDTDDALDSSPSITPSSTPSPDQEQSSSGQFQRVRIGNLQTYEHDTGTFSIDVPQQWKVKDNSKPGEVIVVWTDPTGNAELVADIFNSGQTPSQDDLTRILRDFLEETFGDKPDFFIEDPRPQKDGSVLLIWGYTGTATGNIKVKLLGNSFIENQGRRVAVLSYLVPGDQFNELEGSLNKIINTFKIDSSADLPSQ